MSISLNAYKKIKADNNLTDNFVSTHAQHTLVDCTKLDSISNTEIRQAVMQALIEKPIEGKRIEVCLYKENGIRLNIVCNLNRCLYFLFCDHMITSKKGERSKAFCDVYEPTTLEIEAVDQSGISSYTIQHIAPTKADNEEWLKTSPYDYRNNEKRYSLAI